MRRAPLTFTLGAAILLLASPAVNAMGFGRTVTATTLGQPLDFSAGIVLDADESLPRECVRAEVFVGDTLLPAPNVRVALERAGDGNGRTVRVTTATLIDEPIVTVEVSIGCGSRVSRRFVALVDPPLVFLAEAQGGALPAQRGSDARTATVVEAVRGADAARRRPGVATPAGAAAASQGRVRSAGRRPAGNQRMAAAAPRSSDPRSRTPRSARSAQRQGGTNFAAAPSRGAARLQLEAAPLVVAAAAPTIVPSPLTLAATAPPPAEAASQAQAGYPERERMQTLEAGITKLNKDSQANQTSIATLQARLRQAESDRYANGLVYALAAGLIFFALLAAALLALRPRQRRRSRWFDAAANQQARALRNPGSSASAARAGAAGLAPAAGPDPASWPGSRPSVSRATAPATIGGLEVSTLLGPEGSRPAAAAESVAWLSAVPAASKRGRSLTMEELIDLEQQADFFVVLGQDEAAIDLLSDPIREGGDVSPLPFLKLLEIHRRRDDQPAYERVSESFQEHFHAFAPDWSSGLQFGRSLEAYPQAIARLQALWATPMQAMQTLDSLIFRRREGDDAFDFPAYRELLFLYSVARELAGNVETDFGPIDLFLPLDDASPEASPERRGGADRKLDLDVSSVSADIGEEELVVRRSPGRLGRS